GPGASSPLPDCRHRTVTDLANHLWWPIDSYNPSPQVAVGCLALAASSEGHRNVYLRAITLDSQHDFAVRTQANRIHHLLPVIEGLAIKGQQAVAGFQPGSLGRSL